MTDDVDPPLTAPLSRTVGWAEVQRMSQSAAHRDDPALHAVRATAAVRRGTRMLKVLSPGQLSGHIAGWQVNGFCFRACDVAHLRTPGQLAALRTDTVAPDEPEVAFALRWRAVDPADYEIPMGGVQDGLTAMPAHDRVGAMVLGTGFTPSTDDLIPEVVTAGVTDLPLPANAQLLAYTPDGDEIVLYTYQPEQHAWMRLTGPRHRHLLDGLPGVSPDRDFVPCVAPGAARLIGRVDGSDEEYEAVADPPGEFRIRALTRAARYPVTSLSRRAEQAEWRDVTCWVIQRDDTWARLRVARPDADAAARLGARCYERGVYEVWAPVGELAQHRLTDVAYTI